MKEEPVLQLSSGNHCAGETGHEISGKIPRAPFGQMPGKPDHGCNGNIQLRGGCRLHFDGVFLVFVKKFKCLRTEFLQSFESDNFIFPVVH